MTTPDAHTLYTQSLQWFKQGRADLALAALQTAVDQQPTEPKYALQLAAFQRELEALDAARDTLSAAIQVCPEVAALHYELGCLFHVAGQLDYALSYYREALGLEPELAEAWHQLGRLLLQLEKPEQATEAFTQALSLQPKNARFANSAGLHYYFLKQAEASRRCFAQALEHLAKDAPETVRASYCFNAAMAELLEPVDFNAALAHFSAACVKNAAYTQEVLKLGLDFLQQRSYRIAEGFLTLALSHAEDAETRFFIHVKLANCYERLGYLQSTLNHYQEALVLRPDRWLLELQAGLLLPHIYDSVEGLLQWRDRYALSVQYFLERLDAQALPRSIQSLSIDAPPFLLAYQGLNHKVLLTLLSQLWRKALHLSPEPLVKAKPVAPSSVAHGAQPPRKIALMSAFFFNHSVSGVYLGLVEHWAQRSDIELHFFSLGQISHDDTTDYLQSVGHYHVLPSQASLPEMAAQVAQVAPDILLYPEVGSEPLAYFLAHLRLAPVQIAMYGHPSTTGISTVDYFASPASLELPEAQAHYTEKLLPLPHAPFRFQPEDYRAQAADFDRQSLDCDAEDHLYVVPSALFKIHPKMDAVFRAIYDRDPQAVFCFIYPTGTRWHEILRKRLRKVLPEQALRFIQYLPKPQFLGLLRDADVLLDTFYFASGNVSYQCFALGLPIITLPGQLMRSRTTAGLYEWMEIDVCTARNEAHFVELCVKMATDQAFKADAQAQVRAAAPRLFDIDADLAESCRRIEAVYASH